MNEAVVCCCPYCGAGLTLDVDGFAFTRSQVIMHLSTCESQPAKLSPAHLSPAEATAIATELTEQANEQIEERDHTEPGRTH